MKKKNIIIICALVLALLPALAGCGGTSDVNLDPAALAEALVSQNDYEDPLSPLNDGAFYAIYGIDPAGGSLESYAVYASTGATAEEVAVLAATDTSKVKELETAVRDRIEAQKTGFENYIPKELEKLGDPVVEVHGRYVIMCISNHNDKAKEIIGEFTK